MSVILFSRDVPGPVPRSVRPCDDCGEPVVRRPGSAGRWAKRCAECARVERLRLDRVRKTRGSES